MMKTKPILFQPEMVRAILDGKKSQTRRKLVLGNDYDFVSVGEDGRALFCDRVLKNLGSEMLTPTRCPYGGVGARLWVRETWSVHQLESIVTGHKEYPNVLYKADSGTKLFINDYVWQYCRDKFSWRPSIFMPQWASRITLEITNILVQHVADITEEDAKAEGAEHITLSAILMPWDNPARGYRAGFRNIWNSINGKPKPVYKRDKGKRYIAYYESFPFEPGNRVETFRGRPHYVHGNPWVWALSFRRIEQ